MGKEVVYEVTNIKTGEKFVGTGEEVAERLGVSRAYVSKQWSEGGRVKFDWKVEKLDEKVIAEKSNNGSIPYTLQEEWDKVTADFKRLSARKASKVVQGMTDKEALEIIGNVPVAISLNGKMSDIRKAYDIIKNSIEELEQYRAIGTIEEFKALKDAGEQGLVLRFPCKVGDVAWVIDEDFEYPKKKKIYEAKWTRVTLVQIAANHSFELRGEVRYQVYDCFYDDGRTMLNGMYVGQHHTKVGEVVFLTKEEAEQALAKMKGEQ